MAQGAERLLEMPPRRILIAIGNPLRRDDGVAHRVVELLGAHPKYDTRCCLQLAPELAAEIAAYHTVVFLDADAGVSQIRWDEVAAPIESAPLSHAATASDVIAIARELFGFSGQAWTCRLPVCDFSHGEGLSALAEAQARRCASQLGHPHELHVLGEEEAGNEQPADLRDEADAAVLLRDLG